MKHLPLLLITLLVFSFASADEKEYSFKKLRIDQFKYLNTRLISEWPKEGGLLYQGLHHKLDKPVKNQADFEAAIKLVPEKLKTGFYEPKYKTIEELDGWFVVEAGISVIAIKKGTDILKFGYQW